MKLVKLGCLAIVIVVIAIIVAVSSLSPKAPAVVETPAEKNIAAKNAEEKAKPDPIKTKFGMTEEELKQQADLLVRSLVKQHLGVPASSVVTGWDNNLKFFEFERYEKSKPAKLYAGVNIHNKCSVVTPSKKTQHEYWATLHYDPQAKKWTLNQCKIDGEKVNYVIQ